MSEGDKIHIDIPGRKLELLVPEDEILGRLRRVKVVDRKPKGILMKYRKLVTNASDGAVCR